MWAAAALLACMSAGARVLHAKPAPGAYTAPEPDARLLGGVDFAGTTPVDPQLTALYGKCDANQGRGGCYTDQAHNTAILRFGDGTIFFDAKMAIDADGSMLSKRHEHPNQPETSLQYPGTKGSLDSERVPYVVMPLGDFRRETGVMLGDLAAVVKDGRLEFAVVGDLGPRTHIGEASMKLHTQLGRSICTAYDAEGNCDTFTDTSIDPPVLYFLFPNTRRLIYDDGLNARNINERIATAGAQVWKAFLERQREEEGTKR